MLPSAFIIVDFFVLLLLLAIFKVFRRPSSSVPLPPGPKTSWLGRANVPATRDYPWKVYRKWREIYGDVIYIYVLGNPLIILNSRKAARDLFENQSSVYSSRPCRTMVNELMGWDWIFSSMPYGDTWRRHRRLFHNHFNPAASQTYQDVQIKEAHSLLRWLADNPEDFARHVRRESAAIVMNISYGYQISPEDDYYVSLADRALMTLAHAGLLGTYLVDYIPALKHLPAWLPGAQFKKKAAEWAKLSRAMIDEPFQMTRRLMSDGKAKPSLATTELEALANGKDAYYDETVIKNVSAISYAAGAETTVSVILAFFLAMTLYPDIQKRAQEEIDNVTGRARLPTFEDRSAMPYVNGLVFESLRWNPVVPLGLAHYSVRENIYNGMRIPKGTSVFANIWGILHDEALYPDAMAFKPERFLEKPEPGVNEYPIEVFGFGRRICPGRYLAEATVWITIASVLSAFSITKAVDANGQIIEPDPEFSSTFLSRPKPFRCKIEPRSEATLKLIRDTIS